MAHRGPKPKPTVLRILEGNPGRRPLPQNEPQPKVGLPRCPSSLSPDAKKLWQSLGKKLAGCGLVTETDGPAFELLITAYLEWHEAAAKVAQTGPVWLEKGVEIVRGPVGYTFTGFRMISHESMQVLADIRLRRDGATRVVSPGMHAGAGGTQPIIAKVPDLGELQVARIDADRGRVAVMLPAASAPPAAVVELSTHPFINLVWIGALLTLIGSAMAGMRRAAERAPRPRPGREQEPVYSASPKPV